MNHSWGETAKQIVQTIGTGNIISLAVLAIVLTGIAAYFNAFGEHSHRVFYGILFITMMIAGAGWIVGGINVT